MLVRLMRRQASLYISNLQVIENLRSRYNPRQSRLVPAHVTLCREDEVTDWDAFRSGLESQCPFQIQLEFGKPVREHNFVYLPVLNGHEQFQQLRRAILENEPRLLVPHLTLIHPRNGICTEQIFADISQQILPFRFTFREVMLIQQEADGAWELRSRVGTTDLNIPTGNVTNA